MTCNCWVADQSEEDRFCIRYGAHAYTCPTYRASLDPVDRANDEELRERHLIGKGWGGGPANTAKLSGPANIGE